MVTLINFMSEIHFLELFQSLQKGHLCKLTQADQQVFLAENLAENFRTCWLPQ